MEIKRNTTIWLKDSKNKVNTTQIAKPAELVNGKLNGLFINPYEEYSVTICGQTIMLTSEEPAEVLSVLPEKKREIIYLYFFGRYTQQEIGEIYGRCRSTAWYHIHSALQMLHEEMELLFHEES